MHFEFATASRVIFGAGAAAPARLLALVNEHGSRPMRITGRRLADTADFVVPAEPTIHLVREGVEACRNGHFDCVLAIGGGSVIDAAKAIAILATNPGSDPLDYLEVVGRGHALRRPGLPCIAVPTTAGTGSEVTRNAVLASPADRMKASLRSPFMLPAVALVDPDLTLDLPPAITASTGLDALTQLIEPVLSIRANPFTDALCLEGIRRAAASLKPTFLDGHNREARAAMSYAALLGGMALANAGLGVIHGFAAPIGGMFPDAPHGAVCAALLPHGMQENLAAIKHRAPEKAVRFAEIARILTNTSSAHAEDGIEWIQRLVDDLHIPGLSSYGITPADVPGLVEKAANASSMKANPPPLTMEELTQILTAAL